MNNYCVLYILVKWAPLGVVHQVNETIHEISEWKFKQFLDLANLEFI